MAVIDIGPGAIDRAGLSGNNYTVIDLANPSNDTGWLTSFEVWLSVAGSNGTGVKMGVFSGSGHNYDDRDYETIGTVTIGSKQTFTGKNCDVSLGDFLGIYTITGAPEIGSSGGSGYEYLSGDKFGSGVLTYTGAAGYVQSVYATGSTDAPSTTVMPIFMHHYLNNAG